LAINTLWCGFDVALIALGGLAHRILHSAFAPRYARADGVLPGTPRRDHGVYPMWIIESPLFAEGCKSGIASLLFSARLVQPIPADRAAVPP
jgi:hypothetical protein